MREWLTIIIVLLIVGVLLDGWRRMRQSKRQSIRMKLKTNKSDEKGFDDNFTSELPNGGARVVGHRDLENARELTRHLQKSYGKKKKVTRPRPAEPASLNLDEDVPMLMDSVDDDQVYSEPSLHHDDDDFEPEDILMTGGRRDRGFQDHVRQPPLERSDERRFAAEPVQQRLLDDDEAEYEHDDYEVRRSDARRRDLAPGKASRYRTAADDYDRQQPDADDSNPAAYDPDDVEAADFDSTDYDSTDYDPEDFDPADFDPADYDPTLYEPEEQRTHAAPMAEPEHDPEEVLVINVMSTGSDRFYGPELLDVILDCGMRYGDMQIFHRHESEDGDGHLLFSMVNMVVPGTFDLDTIDEFETPGVSLFMTLPMKTNSMEAFNIMADTAKAIAASLGGELKDEQRSVMTAQTLEHCRQRIREFERKRLSRV